MACLVLILEWLWPIEMLPVKFVTNYWWWYVCFERKAPAVSLIDYQRKLTSYTGGRGHINCMLIGYDFCHNELKVIEKSSTNKDRIKTKTGDSVWYSTFCYHGAGRTVKWDEVQGLNASALCTRGRKSLLVWAEIPLGMNNGGGRKLASDAELLAMLKTCRKIQRGL